MDLAEATSVSLYATTLVIVSFVSDSNDEDAPGALLQSCLPSALDNVCEVLNSAIESPVTQPIMKQTVVALDAIATSCSRYIRSLC
jgi:Mor family transcriptional regulator